jgi:hypothetical protein
MPSSFSAKKEAIRLAISNKYKIIPTYQNCDYLKDVYLQKPEPHRAIMIYLMEKLCMPIWLV